jgi:hypothetical protein
VEARSDVDAEETRRLHDRGRAPDSPRGTIEARHETVTGGLDLPPTEPVELFAHGPVVRIEPGGPPAITESGCQFGRSDDVSKENGRQNALDRNPRAFAGHELFNRI